MVYVKKEPLVRLGVFLVGFAVVASVEAGWPSLNPSQEWSDSQRHSSDQDADRLAIMPRSMLRGFFTENVGQLRAHHVRFYGGGGGVLYGFSTGSVILKLSDPSFSPNNSSDKPHLGENVPEKHRTLVIEQTFNGAGGVWPEGRGELTHRSNFFYGSNPSMWRTGVLNFNEIVYRGAYPGIDISYTLSDTGLKYEFRVQTNGNVQDIGIQYRGVDALEIDSLGALLIHTRLGDLQDTTPVAYQTDGRRVQCRFVISGEQAYGFDCASWDRSQSLVIDPHLYSTYLGGGLSDTGTSITADSSGNAYVTGGTASTDFPTTPGVVGEFDELGTDAFVTKLKPDGSELVYSTFLGGSDFDSASGIALDSSNRVYLAGGTRSTDFPTQPGSYDELPGGNTCSGNPCFDAFVTALGVNGNFLLYSTYLGGGADDLGVAIALDVFNQAFVTGRTFSSDFPTTPGVAQPSINGPTCYLSSICPDAFVTKLSSTGGSLDYSTFLGGENEDLGRSIAWRSGNAYVTGSTLSPNFPLLNAYDSEIGDLEGFVTKVAPMGDSWVYSTFLGGSGAEFSNGIDVDSSGAAYVAGSTRSTNFPTTSGVPSCDGFDAFVTKFTSSGTSLSYSRCVGGSLRDEATSIALYSDEAVITGRTGSSNYPLTADAFDKVIDGYEAFVTRLSSLGTSVIYSTVLGGSSKFVGEDFCETGSAIEAKLATESVFVTGHTCTTDFPTTSGAYDIQCGTDGKCNRPCDSCAALSDAFVVKLSPPTVPGPPQNLIAMRGNTLVELEWQRPADDGGAAIGGYNVFRRVVPPDPPGSETLRASLGDVKNFRDSGLINGQQYCYRVSALNSMGEGSRSTEACATPAFVPDEPRYLVALSGILRVTLTWERPTSDGGSAIEGYKVYRFGVEIASVPGDVLTYLDLGLTRCTSYCYRVSAFNVIGEGPFSNQACAVPTGPSPGGPDLLTTEWRSEWFDLSDTVAVAVTAADVDDDGRVEIVTGGWRNSPFGEEPELRVWRMDDCALVPETARAWHDSARYGGAVFGVSAGNVDGDAATEIVTAGYVYRDSLRTWDVRIWRSDGSALAEEQTLDWSVGGIVVVAEARSVYLQDTDGDGYTEIFLTGMVASGSGGYLGVLQIWEWDPNPIPGHYEKLAETTWGIVTLNTEGRGVAVGELSDPPTSPPEVVVAGFTTVAPNQQKRSQLSLWTWNGLSLGTRIGRDWGPEGGDTAHFSTYIGDVGGTAQKEILTAGQAWTGIRVESEVRVLHWDGVDFVEEAKRTWYDGTGSFANSVHARNVDRDSQIELLVAGAVGTLGNAQLTILNWNGATGINEEKREMWSTGGSSDAWGVFALDVEVDGVEEIITVGRAWDPVWPYRIAQIRIWNWNIP